MKKPSGAELGRGLLRHAPIALEDVRPLHLDHADLARRQAARPVSGRRRAPHARQRQARPCPAPGPRHTGWRCSCSSRSCRSARGWRGRCAPDTRDASRRAAAPSPRRTGACAAAASRVRPGCCEQADVEGRHAHQRSSRAAWRAGPRRVELRQEDHRRAGHQHHVRRHEQPVRMVDRQRVDAARRRAVKRQTSRQRQRIGGEVVVAQHRALGAARRARGVEDRGEIVAARRPRSRTRRALSAAGIGQRALAVGIERLDRAHAAARRDRRPAPACAGSQTNSARLGVAEEIFDLGRACRRC